MNGISWRPPKYEQTRKLPFIPLESELDALIASAGKKMAAILQLLKEVPIRIGEACRLKWIDLDSERNALTINEPEKGPTKNVQSQRQTCNNAQRFTSKKRIHLWRNKGQQRRKVPLGY